MARTLTVGLALAFLAGEAHADVDPAIAKITLPADITWATNEAAGNQTAILMGDPAKPGPYIYLVRWLPGHMSRPHYHANDRYITVLEGTWWVGTGDVYDPASTVPAPAGTFVHHIAQKIHYDGAKDEPCVIQIVGEGPGTSIPAAPP